MLISLPLSAARQYTEGATLGKGGPIGFAEGGGGGEHQLHHAHVFSGEEVYCSVLWRWLLWEWERRSSIPCLPRWWRMRIEAVAGGRRWASITLPAILGR